MNNLISFIKTTKDKAKLNREKLILLSITLSFIKTCITQSNANNHNLLKLNPETALSLFLSHSMQLAELA
jgi:hypothetical protein